MTQFLVNGPILYDNNKAALAKSEVVVVFF